MIEEIEDLMEAGRIQQIVDGGLLFENRTMLIPGSEIEIYDENCKGPIHVLCFFPTLVHMKEFSAWLSSVLKNIHLSSQRIYATGRQLQEKVKEIVDSLYRLTYLHHLKAYSVKV